MTIKLKKSSVAKSVVIRYGVRTVVLETLCEKTMDYWMLLSASIYFLNVQCKFASNKFHHFNQFYAVFFLARFA